MTVPAQRGPDMGGQDVLHYLAGTVDQLVGSVERGFRETRADVAALRAETVTRREFDQRIGGVEAEIADIKRQREQEARDRAEQERLAQHARRNDRWQKFALAVSVLLALIAAAVTITLHYL